MPDRIASPRNPFREHPFRRYAYAWEWLAGAEGEHLDVGIRTGEFVCTLARTTALRCTAVDPNRVYVDGLRERCPEVRAQQIGIHPPLPFPDGTFASITLLDTLEHVPDEQALLDDLGRVLRPGGLLVVTVPADHVFSFLDPDNAKFQTPHLHRLVWGTRFGRAEYRTRFLDTSNQLVGDMSVGKRRHTNFSPGTLAPMLGRAGLVVVDMSAANLFWRWFQVPGLFAPTRAKPWFDRAILADGRRFNGDPGAGLLRLANLYAAARKSGD